MVEKGFQRTLTPQELEEMQKSQEKQIAAMRLKMDIDRLKKTVENLVQEITPHNKDEVLELMAEYKREMLYKFGMLKAIVKPSVEEEEVENEPAEREQ
jgi:hypothetical protein